MKERLGLCEEVAELEEKCKETCIWDRRMWGGNQLEAYGLDLMSVYSSINLRVTEGICICLGEPWGTDDVLNFLTEVDK